jgi:hypothetical protein
MTGRARREWMDALLQEISSLRACSSIEITTTAATGMHSCPYLGRRTTPKALGRS